MPRPVATSTRMIIQLYFVALLVAGSVGYRKPKEMMSDYEDRLPGFQRNIEFNQTKWWPRTVNYYIEPTFSKTERAVISRAIGTIENVCNVKFKKSNKSNYIHVEKKTKWLCISYHIGMKGGMQVINLGWVSLGVTIKTFIQALGFWGQHQSYNRDDYITVVHQNIDPDYFYSFKKLSQREATSFGFPYDYESITHYSTKAFSQNGKPTIITKDPAAQQIIGQRDGLSAIDVKKLLIMFPQNKKLDEYKSTNAAGRFYSLTFFYESLLFILLFNATNLI